MYLSLCCFPVLPLLFHYLAVYYFNSCHSLHSVLFCFLNCFPNNCPGIIIKILSYNNVVVIPVVYRTLLLYRSFLPSTLCNITVITLYIYLCGCIYLCLLFLCLILSNCVLACSLKDCIPCDAACTEDLLAPNPPQPVMHAPFRAFSCAHRPLWCALCVHHHCPELLVKSSKKDKF